LSIRDGSKIPVIEKSESAYESAFAVHAGTDFLRTPNLLAA
jgi:hypothetical protein